MKNFCYLWCLIFFVIPVCSYAQYNYHEVQGRIDQALYEADEARHRANTAYKDYLEIKEMQVKAATQARMLVNTAAQHVDYSNASDDYFERIKTYYASLTVLHDARMRIAGVFILGSNLNTWHMVFRSGDAYLIYGIADGVYVENVTVTVQDMNGNVLMKKTGYGHVELCVESRYSGTYQVTVSTPDNTNSGSLALLAGEM